MCRIFIGACQQFEIESWRKHSCRKRDEGSPVMIAGILSTFAVIVSVLSFFVASEKFRLDLYNKRFEIYNRTVRFYQLLMKSNGINDDDVFLSARNDFITASRESQFLFSPESGIPDLLLRLNKASFIITGLRETQREMPVEQKIALQKQFGDALMLWNESLEPLEVMMSPYLNYHYAFSPLALFAQLRKRALRS